MILDIHYKSENELERNLSNFALHAFEFDGVPCSCIEAPLQAFKNQGENFQRRICAMDPVKIHKIYRKAFDSDWKRTQRLFWKDKKIKRASVAYSVQLTRLFDSAFEQSETYRDALQASVGYELMHSVGKYDMYDTVLTIPEYLYHTYRLRSHFE